MEESTQDRRLTGGSQVTVRAKVGELAGNPDNGREDLGDLEELAESFRVRGQLQAITVISREAFLKIKPEHTDKIGEEIRFVVLYGHRRLAAARRVGLDVVKIDVAASPENATALRASALVENIHRKNLAPLEEAQEVAALVDDLGSQAEAARQLGLSTAWVSQRLALRRLLPELQEKLRAGELKVKEARSLGTLEAEEQLAAWKKGVNRVNGLPGSKEPGVTDDDRKPSPGRKPTPQPGVPPVDAPEVGDQPVGSGEQNGPPVQLMLVLEWEPATAAKEIVAAYGQERAEELAAAILDVS